MGYVHTLGSVPRGLQMPFNSWQRSVWDLLTHDAKEMFSFCRPPLTSLQLTVADTPSRNIYEIPVNNRLRAPRLLLRCHAPSNGLSTCTRNLIPLPLHPTFS